MCLSHSAIVALREIGTRMRAAALRAHDRAADDRLAAIEQIAQLECERQGLIEDAAFVADRDRLIAFLEALQPIESLPQTGFVAIEPDQLVHHRRQLEAQPGVRLAGVRTVKQLAQAFLLASQESLAAGARRRAFCVVGRDLTRTPAEDDRVEQRVGTETVPAVNAHARDFARRVQAGHGASRRRRRS